MDYDPSSVVSCRVELWNGTHFTLLVTSLDN
jgi:hypothetical protein